MHARALRFAFEFTNPRFGLARLRNPQFQHAFGRSLERGVYGMQTINIVALRISHDRRVHRACRRLGLAGSYSRRAVAAANAGPA